MIGAEAAPTNQLAAYGFSGELIPIRDPDSVIDVNTLWDQMVTKPVQPTQTAATSVVDFDWDTADSGPDTEPGEVDVNDLLGLLDPTTQIMAPTLEWMSFAKQFPRAVVAGSPDTYTPADFKRFRSTRNLVAKGPSYAMMAVSSPDLDNDDTTEDVVIGASHWAIMENIHNAINDMWKMQTGATESGAEAPYDIISQIIGEWIAPNMIDPVSTLLDPMQYTVFCITDFVLDVPNAAIPNVLDANNG